MVSTSIASSRSWSFPAIADALAAVIRQREAELNVEQTPHGLDRWDEKRFHEAFAAGLSNSYEVAREVHYPSTAGKMRTHRPRCDLVLSPRGWPLRRDETLPLNLWPAEAALWLEVKVARQYGDGGSPNRSYGSEWREVAGDLAKMREDPLTREGGVALLAFTSDRSVFEHDLASFETLFGSGGILLSVPYVRSLAVTDRIGHRLVTVVLWPLG
jgi:hypothetical protein